MSALIQGKVPPFIVLFPPSFLVLQVFRWPDLCSDLTEKHTIFPWGFLPHPIALFIIRILQLVQQQWEQVSDGSWVFRACVQLLEERKPEKEPLGPECVRTLVGGFFWVAQQLHGHIRKAT